MRWGQANTLNSAAAIEHFINMVPQLPPDVTFVRGLVLRW